MDAKKAIENAKAILDKDAPFLTEENYSAVGDGWRFIGNYTYDQVQKTVQFYQWDQGLKNVTLGDPFPFHKHDPDKDAKLVALFTYDLDVVVKSLVEEDEGRFDEVIARWVKQAQRDRKKS